MTGRFLPLRTSKRCRLVGGCYPSWPMGGVGAFDESNRAFGETQVGRVQKPPRSASTRKTSFPPEGERDSVIKGLTARLQAARGSIPASRSFWQLVQQGRMHVTALCALLGQSQPAVSHHLTLMRMIGLVGFDRNGKHNFYYLASDHLRDLFEQFFADTGNGRQVPGVRRLPCPDLLAGGRPDPLATQGPRQIHRGMTP